MKLKIVGMGISGAFLARLLKDNTDIKFVAYDDNKRPGCGCGWGSPKSNLKKLLKEVDLKLEDFVLAEMKHGVINGVEIPVKNSVTINKPKLIRRLKEGFDIIPEKFCWRDAPSNGIVINATGKPHGGIQYYVQTYQELVEINGLKKETSYLFIDPRQIGYAWIFPLDRESKRFHFGAGSLDVKPDTLMEKMLKFYEIEKGKIYCSCRQPLIAGEHVKIVDDNYAAVGGAAGCVHPITGGGIIPSLETAYALYVRLAVEKDTMHGKWAQLRHPVYEWGYPMKVREILKGYDEAFRITNLMLDHTTWGWLKALGHIKRHSQANTKPEFSLKNTTQMIFNTLKLLHPQPLLTK